MTQKGLDASLRVRWAFYLYVATVAIFLLAVLAGVLSMVLASGGFTRGLTLVGAGGILGSTTLLLKGPISRFYDYTVRENVYEKRLAMREWHEDRLWRNRGKLGPDEQEMALEFWRASKEDERRAFESWSRDASGCINGKQTDAGVRQSKKLVSRGRRRKRVPLNLSAILQANLQ